MAISLVSFNSTSKGRTLRGYSDIHLSSIGSVASTTLLPTSLRTRMIKEFNSLTPTEQRRVYDIILAKLRNATVLDSSKESHNLEMIIALSYFKIIECSDHSKDYDTIIDWADLSNTFPDAAYLEEQHLKTTDCPRGITTYHLTEAGEDVTMNTAVDLNGTPMSEERINDIVNLVYNRRKILLPANKQAMDIIYENVIPDGMLNRYFAYPAAAILHQMRIELQFHAQLGAMNIMTQAQKEFSILMYTRKVQNRVMDIYDTYLQMLLQGPRLSSGSAETSLTACLADSLRTTYSMESKTFPATVCQQSYTDISAIRAVGSTSPSNVVATLNRTISKFTRE